MDQESPRMVNYSNARETHLRMLIERALAHLPWDKRITYEHHSIYNSEDETAVKEAWDAIKYDFGSVALDDTYVSEMGLPKSQRFPWDNSKGIYYLNSFHQLHCLVGLIMPSAGVCELQFGLEADRVIQKLIRESFLLLKVGEPLEWSWGHNMHCFDAIRQEIMCAADDTPRSSTREHPGRTGVGQSRWCRDWDKLEAWAKERWSCWRDIEATNKSFDTLLRYRYCPPESAYYERIHQLFGEFEI